ncbi:MAG: hotdog fold thioesterase [Alphaproteobacteria bacterium]|nr:hotdog fold thioesterase [Alphaproteobacteria bacterium]
MNEAERFNAAQKDHLPDHLGLVWEEITHGYARGRFVVEKRHMAPNGYMHAGSVVTFLDTACGYACVVSRPEGAVGFITIELKTNFFGTAAVGDEIMCEARLVHGGRTTQVWDAEARNAGKVIAAFRCTQMILYPKG